MKDHLPYKYIAVEGNIGAGKTTLCHQVQRDFSCRLVLEQFTDNPFLPYFYKNPKRYALQVELFFMTERHKQLQEHLAQGDLFAETVISDYFFLKTLLFAKSNLNPQEFRLFQRLFNVLNATFQMPQLLVFLYRPIEELLHNISKRGRQIEAPITAEYLQKIQDAYFSYFKTAAGLPILLLNVEGIDFTSNTLAYQQIINLLKTNHKPGVHRIDIADCIKIQ